MTSAVFFVGCSKPPPPLGSLVDGSVRGEWTDERTYSNAYFGLRLSIPSEWTLLKGDEKNLTFTLRSLGIAASNSEVEDALRGQFSKIHVPMRALALPQEDYARNPNVLVMIENLEDKPSVKTGFDLMKGIEATAGAIPHAPRFEGAPTKTTINGLDLWTRSSTNDVNGGEGVLWAGAGGYTARQQGYCSVKGHYGITILCTWFSSNDNPLDGFASKHLTAMESSTGKGAAVKPAQPAK